MVSETATPAPYRPRGPVASTIKWAFKRYFRAQRAIGDVFREAQAEAGARTPDTSPAATPTTDGPVSDHGVHVRWFSSGAAEQRPIEEIGALLGRDDGFVWLDIPTFDDAAEHMLTKQFRFHPLAVHDCRVPGPVPKVHAYADHQFLMLHAAHREPSGQIRPRELNQFLGSRYLVTVHEQPRAPELENGHLETDAVLGRIEAGRALPCTPAELSYSIITRLAAHMEELVSQLARSVAVLNRSLVTSRGGVSESDIDEMFALRDALIAVETMAAQNHAICARMATLAARIAPTGPHPLLNDVLDQFERIRDLCQAKREQLQGILDVSRTRATTTMDRAMSRLALLSAVALPVSVIADLYGMNVLVLGQMQLMALAMMLGAVVLFTSWMLRLAKR
jgi:Mg2+ and Co2+ transporter CorA